MANLLRCCGKRGFPSSSLMEGSLRNHSELSLIEILLPQLPEGDLSLPDADRARSNRIIAMGTIRQNEGAGKPEIRSILSFVTHETMAETAKSLGLGGKEPILIAGSTHPGRRTRPCSAS